MQQSHAPHAELRGQQDAQPTQRAPDGWDSARFLELFLSYGSFPFRELVLPPSRYPTQEEHLRGRCADASRWADIEKCMIQANVIFRKSDATRNCVGYENIHD